MLNTCNGLQYSVYLPYKLNKDIMIQYKEVHQNYINVFLDKKRVGHIIIVAGGFQYRTKKNKGRQYSGNIYNTIDEVKYSLEHEK